ncbi:UDP-N-acetylmuramyl-tripeptide synthetase [Candidatus Parcubacteria bacterium]|nr:MAG: UDP-N-acetylmuramyl-tripeptide synthetase [Candidatus Parcubacteria bacterium]
MTPTVMLERIRDFCHKQPLARRLLRLYHLLWACMAAWWFDYPSRKLVVVGVTGTKGKTTTTEMIYTILRAAGYKTALTNTIHFVIDGQEERNLFKMTMPGRGFLQKFLAKALAEGATHAVVEMTSLGAVVHRHYGIELDGFVFTMLEPEHIEAHGSFEAYRKAKRRLLDSLIISSKLHRFVVANADDEEGKWYLAERSGIRAIPFSLKEVRFLREDGNGSEFVYNNQRYTLALPGRAAVANALAAVKVAEALGVPPAVAKQALANLTKIPGRLERVVFEEWAEQDVEVVVDYAHTPESLRALYQAFPGKTLVCVLGSCGGGRDRWKRPRMAEVADAHCAAVYLTDEDPYDEDPREIIEDLRAGIRNQTPIIELDRHQAILRAVVEAPKGSVVVLSGKGTDPYIMGPRGSKIPWSDAAVAREALRERAARAQ